MTYFFWGGRYEWSVGVQATQVRFQLPTTLVGIDFSCQGPAFSSLLLPQTALLRFSFLFFSLSALALNFFRLAGSQILFCII